MGLIQGTLLYFIDHSRYPHLIWRYCEILCLMKGNGLVAHLVLCSFTIVSCDEIDNASLKCACFMNFWYWRFDLKKTIEVSICEEPELEGRMEIRGKVWRGLVRIERVKTKNKRNIFTGDTYTEMKDEARDYTIER